MDPRRASRRMRCKRRRNCRRSQAEPIAVGLNAAVLAVQGDEPVGRRRADTATSAPRRRAAERPVLARQHDSLESGAALLGADQTGIELGLARRSARSEGAAASPARRQRPPTASPSATSPCSTRASGVAGGAVARMVRILPLGGLAERPARTARRDHRALSKGWPAGPLRGVTPATGVSACGSAFGFDGGAWDEEKVLERYELMYEAGLVDEPVNGREPARWRAAQAAQPRLTHAIDQRRSWPAPSAGMRRPDQVPPGRFSR